MGFFSNLFNNKTSNTTHYTNLADLTNYISSKIPNKKVAYQFVMEELEAAQYGNEYAQQFVKNSGFRPEEYIGAMSRSFEEVDGPNGPQQALISQVMSLPCSIDQKVELRVSVVKNIIEQWLK